MKISCPICHNHVHKMDCQNAEYTKERDIRISDLEAELKTSQAFGHFQTIALDKEREECEKWKGLHYELANVAVRTDVKLTKLTIAAQALVKNAWIQDAVDDLAEALEGEKT